MHGRPPVGHIKSLQPIKAAIEKRFDCHKRSFVPTNLKGGDIVSDVGNIFPFQMAYLDTRGKHRSESTTTTKINLFCTFKDEEQT